MPTKNELKMLKYLGLSESDKVVVRIGNPPCNEISITKANGESLRTVRIPFTDPDEDLLAWIIHENLGLNA